MPNLRRINVNGSHTALRNLLSESPTPRFNSPSSSNLIGMDDYWGMGRLHPVYRDSVRNADYWIYSYNTPIAWRTHGVWHIPDDKYSVTTSKHQGRVRAAIHSLSSE